MVINFSSKNSIYRFLFLGFCKDTKKIRKTDKQIRHFNIFFISQALRQSSDP